MTNSSRCGRVLLTLAVAGLATAAAACGGAPVAPAASASASAATGNVAAGGSGPRAAGSFSRAFAECMRAHGVADFPDPGSKSGQLGPASGIDPNSPDFQSALNGPCKPLAPPGWLASGKVTR